jgi:ribosome maturation factor RimP
MTKEVSMPQGDAGRLIASEVEAAVVAAHPEIEVWDVALVPREGKLRVMIDREGGVDLAACEAVTRTLAPFRERYALEVSSPGLERPLVRPAHFARMVGSTVKVRLKEAVNGRTNVTGRLLAADPEAISVEVEGAPLDIPLSAVGKSNVVWNPVKAQ